MSSRRENLAGLRGIAEDVGSQMSSTAEPLVTAIVSTYAAERFLRGCLDDLLAQSLGERLEILVIDACSPQGEGAIVREYQKRDRRIRYVRTETRENTSQVFNRAIDLARGKYLTTANTDDRHHPRFCELLAGVLEQEPQVGLVYADSLITERENETWAQNSARRRYAWPDYTPAAALSCCLFGAQPLWRRDAHEVAGRWDPQHVHANDQDLFLRIAWRCGAAHVRTPLGLFLARPDSVSGTDNHRRTLDEVLDVMRRYRTAMPLEDVFPGLARAGVPRARAAALIELGNLCARGPYTDAKLALDCWRRATELTLPETELARARAVFANNSACVLACVGSHDQAARAWRLAGDLPEAACNLARAQDGRAPALRELSFAELPHDVVRAGREARGLELGADGVLRWSAPRVQIPWDVFDGPSGIAFSATAETPCVLPRRAPMRASTRSVLLVMYGWADSGGGTILPRAVAKELAARGDRVAVLYAAARAEPSLPPYAVRRHEEDGVALYALCNRPALFMDLDDPRREIDDPRVRALFGELLDERSPDVVHFYNLHNLGMSLPAVCRARGIPTLLSSNNYWPICPRLYLASDRVERCAGPSADGTKCVRCLGQKGTAAAHADRQEAGLELLNEDIDVHLATSARVRDLFVHNGADPARIRVLLQEPPTVDAIWARTGARRDIESPLARPLRAAFVGSVMPHKGVHVLAAALQAPPAGEVEAFAFGNVPADYAAFLRQLDRRGALTLRGAYRQEDLPALLATADVVVVPSIWEDCAPLVVREALAARAPVIGSRIGGIPDFIDDGTTGFLFPSGDAAALARCLAAFREDRTLLGRMQTAIAPPAGFGAHIDAVHAVYDELCAHSTTPAIAR